MAEDSVINDQINDWLQSKEPPTFGNKLEDLPPETEIPKSNIFVESKEK